MTSALPYPVIDGDGHVLEHPDGMLRHAPAQFRERIWHVETKADGSEWLHYNGGVRPAGGLPLAGTGGMTSADPGAAGAGQLRHRQGPPGGLYTAPPLPRIEDEGPHPPDLSPTQLPGLPRA